MHLGFICGDAIRHDPLFSDFNAPQGRLVNGIAAIEAQQSITSHF